MGYNNKYVKGDGSRIPPDLQRIFMESNQGQEVNKPPASAFKVFKGLFWRKGKGGLKKDNSVGAPKIDDTLKNVKPPQTPQQYLDQHLEARGYSVQRYTTINSGYSNMPTPLQLASYDVHILKMIVRDKDEHALREVLSCGISPNACNKYGESLLHKVCKSGLAKILQAFLDCEADVQVSDGTGRTLLHNACWGAKPSFKTFEMILQKDIRLVHMMDGGGTLPLGNVREEHYGAWNMFLKTILDVYWPPREPNAPAQGPPPLALEKACSQPVPDPENALSVELAALVSSGRMEPEAAIEAQEELDDNLTYNTMDIMDDSDFDADFEEDEIEELKAINRTMGTSAAAAITA